MHETGQEEASKFGRVELGAGTRGDICLSPTCGGSVGAAVNSMLTNYPHIVVCECEYACVRACARVYSTHPCISIVVGIFIHLMYYLAP